MARLKNYHFYYGAILGSIFQYNEDASPALVLNDEENRQIYKILTNTSKQECIAFFKYARQPKAITKNEAYSSWLFSFSQDDKDKLRNLYNTSRLPIFLYLLCCQKDLKDSDIAVLKYEEFLKVENNVSITIGVEKNKNCFMLFTSVSRSKLDAILIPRKRIGMKFDELIDEVIKEGKQRYKQHKPVLEDKVTFEALIENEIETYQNSGECPLCGGELITIKISNKNEKLEGKQCSECSHIYMTKKNYTRVYEYNGRRKLRSDVSIMEVSTDEQVLPSYNIDSTGTVSKLKDLHADIIYIIDEEMNRCPIHNLKMDVKVMSFGKKMKDTIFFCRQCNKHIVSEKHSQYLKSQTKNSYELKGIEFKRLQP